MDERTNAGKSKESRSPVQSSNRPFTHAGIVLAAGASTRMGRPKALLQTPRGIPLAAYQADLLKQAGCTDVVIVLGSNAEIIRNQLQSCRCVDNIEWEKGRFTSVQAGLRALSGFDGCFILPVDTVGVGVTTPRAVRECAEKNLASAVRPCHHNQPGRIAWISSKLAGELMQLQDRGLRLDDYLSAIEERVDVEDPAILNNINTPADWDRICAQWPA